MERLTEMIDDESITYIARHDRVNGKIVDNQMCMNKLGEYEDLEEQGCLLKLPCAVGDTVYRINRGSKEPIISMKVCKVVLISLRGCGYEIQIMCRDEANSGETYYFGVDFGKTIFLTRQEAEDKLKRNGWRYMNKFLTNKENFEGKEVDIYAPFGGRFLDRLLVEEVIKDNCLHGKSLISGIETAYYLSDGIRIEIAN